MGARGANFFGSPDPVAQVGFGHAEATPTQEQCLLKAATIFKRQHNTPKSERELIDPQPVGNRDRPGEVLSHTSRVTDKQVIGPAKMRTAREVSNGHRVQPNQIQNLENQARLPAGWQHDVDPSTGRTYYHSEGKSQWELPSRPAAKARSMEHQAAQAAVAQPRGPIIPQANNGNTQGANNDNTNGGAPAPQATQETQTGTEENEKEPFWKRAAKWVGGITVGALAAGYAMGAVDLPFQEKDDKGSKASTIAGCVLGAAALGTAAVVGTKYLLKSDTASSSETASSDNVYNNRAIEPVESSWWSNWYLIPIIGILIMLAAAFFLFFPTVSVDEQNEEENVHPNEDRV